ncbi:MAG: M23 family metallopeptidase [Lachnospiraceae bacterium]
MIKIKIIVLMGVFVVVLSFCYYKSVAARQTSAYVIPIEYQDETSDFIKWVDFDVSYEALCLAASYDINSFQTTNPVSWIDLLAYAAAKTGGVFGQGALTYIEELQVLVCEDGKPIESITKDLKYFTYYQEVYSAVLGGLLGTYEVCIDEVMDIWETHYGIKGFSPIASGFYYEDYDDFGAGRSYGYARTHLGHDMMGQIGTPIIAIESGTVEALGWNQYGGWRIGIRSDDGMRYYYYAHLRQNYPYAEGLVEGQRIEAGQVIGYMGHTGYSTTENVNNIETVHLHWGMELIFDESQKDSDNEIWIDVYAITRFLYQNKQIVEKMGDSREWVAQSMRNTDFSSAEKN